MINLQAILTSDPDNCSAINNKLNLSLMSVKREIHQRQGYYQKFR
jgi:hypothetical protein